MFPHLQVQHDGQQRPGVRLGASSVFGCDISVWVRHQCLGASSVCSFSLGCVISLVTWSQLSLHCRRHVRAEFNSTPIACWCGAIEHRVVPAAHRGLPIEPISFQAEGGVLFFFSSSLSNMFVGIEQSTFAGNYASGSRLVRSPYTMHDAALGGCVSRQRWSKACGEHSFLPVLLRLRQ